MQKLASISANFASVYLVLLERCKFIKTRSFKNEKDI